MPANNPLQPKRSWKDSKPADARTGAGQRGWKKEQAAAGDGSKGPLLTRRGKIGIAVGGLMVCLVGIVVAILLMQRRDPPRFVLIGAGYEPNLAVPDNVFGVRGLDDLQAWTEEYNGGSNAKNAIEVKRKTLVTTEDPLDEALKNCKSPTVVVYFAVHGGTEGQGEFLVPDDANMRTGGFKAYPLSTVLAALKDKLPAKTKKLLVLDATAAGPDAALGLIHSDFVRTLKADQAALQGVPNLAVLLSSDEDQRSWGSEEWGTTIFGHFFLEGLKGAASKQGVVTTKSLADYVAKEVTPWARDNRAALQTPILLDTQNVADDTALALIEFSAYKQPDPKELAKFTEPAGLREAWKKRAELAALQPSPAVYTPHLWRQYLDTLKRYEDLLRKNSPAAATLAGDLGTLATRMREAQGIPFDALGNSLAMPAAFGWSLDPAAMASTKKEFDARWLAMKMPEDVARLLQEWQTKTEDQRQRRLLRLRLEALLLAKAQESEANFGTVCLVLAHPAVRDAGAPSYPAEAYFALMLNRYLPVKGRDWPAVQKVLAVRLQAEEAALGLNFKGDDKLPAYSEQVLPWISSGAAKFADDRESVERGDYYRTVGEDLLFASPGKAAGVADTGKAANDYALLQKKATTVREALDARDHALAELPYYTAWLATLPVIEERDDEAPCVGLWEKVHALCALLDRPAFGKIDELEKPTREVRAGLDALAAKFNRAVPAGKAITQQAWKDADNALLVPFLDADQRMELLNQLRVAGHRLNAEPSPLDGLSKEKNQLDEKAGSQRRGRLALAQLGKDYGSKELDGAVNKPGEMWGKSLAEAGERVAKAYRDLAQDVYRRTEEGRTAPLKEARDKLRTGALEARLLPGAAPQKWTGLDPVGENRRVGLHDLLAYQTRRTFNDYWAGGTDPKQPYYRLAGQVYLSAAKALVTGDGMPDEVQKPRLTEFAELTELLGEPDGLTVGWFDGREIRPGPAKLHVTDEDLVSRSFTLKKEKKAPDGIPAVWTEVGKGLKPADPNDLERRAVPRDKARPDTPVEIEYVLKPEAVPGTGAAKEDSDYDFYGFFRGRVEKLHTKVVLHHRPEITSYLPEFPPEASLLIRADPRDYDRFAAANSELVIVLDFSGSMTLPTKETAGKNPERSRKYEALAALQKCLTQVPRGVHVTLLTFSEEGGGNRINPQWKQVEWDPSSEAVAERIDKLRLLTPAGETPLARATAEAKDYFTPGFDGAKTVLVITDGGDSEFPNPPDETGQRYIDKYGSMRQFLSKQYLNSGIKVNAIGIETDSLVGREKKGLDEYRPAIKALGGEFVPVEDRVALTAKIEKFLMPVRYRVDGEGGKESGTVPPGKIPEDGADLTRSGHDEHWIRGLIPGTFMVSMQTHRLSKKAINQRVRLEGGDALVLRLLPVPNSTKDFVLRRELYGESDDIKNRNNVLTRAATDPAWLLSVLQNQLEENGRKVHPLHLMTAIEKRYVPGNKAEAVGVARPRFVWFNVGTKEAPDKLAPGGLRFYPLPDYPAPAYSLDLAEWVRGTEPVLQAWWTEDLPPVRKILTADEAGKRLMDLKQYGPMKVQPTDKDEATRVVVESIVHQRRAVEKKPGDALADVDCVVVRLRWDPERPTPFFVLPPDELGATGSEHKFYLEAGKYTGVFFNVSPEKLKALDHLPIYSVEDMKLKARRLPGGLPLGVPNESKRPPKP